MSCFLIKYIDTKISVLEYVNEEFIFLKNKGEESWEYQDSYFWDWFKDKIDYEGESLSFIIVSKNEFIIDSSINISLTHDLSIQCLLDIVNDYSNLNLLIQTFPNIDLNKAKKEFKPVISSKKVLENFDDKKLTLQKYFKKQTHRYKKG